MAVFVETAQLLGMSLDAVLRMPYGRFVAARDVLRDQAEQEQATRQAAEQSRQQWEALERYHHG